MEEPVNPQYQLRAYNTTDACQLASILRELTSADAPSVNRQAVVKRWAELWPRGAANTHRRSISYRIRKGLRLMRLAGIVLTQDDVITVINAERLGMSADNLAVIVQDGRQLSPAEWSRRPMVPEELLEVQKQVEQARLTAATEAQPNGIRGITDVADGFGNRIQW